MAQQLGNLRARIKELERGLRRRHPSVSDCRVSMVDRPPHIYECRRFNARLDVAFKGGVFVVNREHDKDPGEALEAAFFAAERKLEALHI